jgi:hypothetical protein
MWKRTILILVILPTIGFLLGYVLAEHKYSQETTWQSLGTPPVPALDIIQISPLIIASTEGEELYEYQYHSGDWELIDQKPSEAASESFPELCEEIPRPSMDGIIASQEECVKFEMGFSYIKYAVLEDGSVWIWNQNVGTHNIDYVLVIISWTVGFYVLGVILLILITILDKKKLGQEKGVDA